MSNRFLVALGISSALVRVAAAQCPAGEWIELAPLNEPRQELATAYLDGRVYAVGGLGGRDDANEIYEVASNAWSLGADLPVGTDHAWSVALGGRVYVGGGREARVFAYDPAADAWTEVAPSAFVHGGTPAAAVIDGRIVVAGGIGGTMTGNEAEAYDPAANRWTTLAPMRCARNHVAGAAIGGRLYVAGGRPGSQTCVEEYDPATNAWTAKAPMPTGRSGAAGAAVGNCLYVFGGEGNPADPNGIFHEVEAYDAAADVWTSLPAMRTGRHGIYAAVVGGVVYLPGGATAQGLAPTGVNEAYVVDVPAQPRQPVLPPGARVRPDPRVVPRP
jgi:N-acetylneuraminic acid mutarotase